MDHIQKKQQIVCPSNQLVDYRGFGHALERQPVDSPA
jgi:hypothetical protein